MEHESKLFNPVDLELSRSTFPFHPTMANTMNAGRLYPEKVIFVQPGDSIKMSMRRLVKMVTPVYPTMDALFQDVAFFFVPFRSILNRRYGTPAIDDGKYSWKYFIGAQDNFLNMPLPANGVMLPTLKIGSGVTDYKEGSLMDAFDVCYFSVNDGKLSALPLMAYFAIWNENYREPNTMAPITWELDSNNNLKPYGKVPLDATKYELTAVRGVSDVSDYTWVNALGPDESGNSDATQDCSLWLPLPVCRFHGYFGSLLPWPQRNATGVQLPLGNSAPVYLGANKSPEATVKLARVNNSLDIPAETDLTLYNYTTIDSTNSNSNARAYGSGEQEGNPVFLYVSAPNAYADLSSATAATVNAVRMAIQKQRWYEKLARSGNRYDELEYGLFGVRPHDSGDDRPLYLGGKRIPLSIEMVASTNGGTSSSSGAGGGSLGALGAYSHTNDEDDYFYHSFDDWGVVICVSCIRHHDTFGSGTDRFWTKLTRDDIYFPTFAHLGEQGTYDYEMSDRVIDGRILGYNPAWEEYRTQHDRVHGLLRPGKSLGFMTYARNYVGNQSLATFLNASNQVETVDQTLSVTSNAAGFQFIVQATFDMPTRRAMPTTSIPGLMDHF